MLHSSFNKSCSISPLKSAFLCVGEWKEREGRVLEAAKLLYSTGTLIRRRHGSALAPMRR